MNNAQLHEGLNDLLRPAMDIEDCWVGRLVAQGEGETYSPPLRDGIDMVPDTETHVVNLQPVAWLNQPPTTLIKFANGQVAKVTIELLAYPEDYYNDFDDPDREVV